MKISAGTIIWIVLLSIVLLSIFFLLKMERKAIRSDSNEEYAAAVCQSYSSFERSEEYCCKRSGVPYNQSIKNFTCKDLLDIGVINDSGIVCRGCP
jgi:hypothetical protein